jgi:hypothetical protein
MLSVVAQRVEQVMFPSGDTRVAQGAGVRVAKSNNAGRAQQD